MGATPDSDDQMTIPHTSIDIRRLLDDGQKKLDRRDDARRDLLASYFRAGSSGSVGPGGAVRGECHRVAFARWCGADRPVDAPRKLMFAAGEGNEQLWENVLVEGWDGQVIRGAEYRRQGSFGTVHGTTDIVLADRNGQGQVVLELKLVSALGTAIQRHVEGKPDIKHLIQAAVYMWMTGLPAVLCYTSRTDFAVQFQAKKLGITKVEPFYRLFYLAMRDGVLWVRDEQQWNDAPTDITVQSIVAYYQLLADMAEQHTLGPRPESEHYNRCDARYCAFSETCDRFENDPTTWKAEVKRICKEAS